MTAIRVLVILLLIAAAGPLHAGDEHAVAIAREVERIARTIELWPGYEPLAIPLAIFDGESTFLFRHPAPPGEFAPAPRTTPAAWMQPGRHPAVVSNTSVDLAGTMTATLLADRPRATMPATELAAVALHEAFHVYQRRAHPTWIGNEGDLLLYPIEDATQLALRRLESEEFQRAQSSSDRRIAACWARSALATRRARFAAMDSAFSRYERRTELNEGLATYVQLRAAGRDQVDFPAGEWRPAEVRLRAYTIGPAIAFLLDRFAPGWQPALDAHDAQFLDVMLAAALEGVDAADSCDLPAAERAHLEARARDDAAAVVHDREARRRAFDALPGWRLVVTAAAGKPLWPQGFDPLNVERTAGGLLHTRLLQLQNESGTVRMLDEAGADLEAVTAGAGAHPLFHGVQSVEVAGLAHPTITREGSKTSLRCAGLLAEFTGAVVREDAAARFLEVHLAR